MKRLFPPGRYANVTATLALIIALGGTSYAAITLPRNSVGAKQIKRGGVANSELRTNAVTSAKVKNSSLRARDFKTGELPAGAPGATNVTVRYAPVLEVQPGTQGQVVVTCEAGEKALSGGVSEGGPGGTFNDAFELVASEPVAASLSPPTGWFVVAKRTAGTPGGFLGFVICAKP